MKRFFGKNGEIRQERRNKKPPSLRGQWLLYRGVDFLSWGLTACGAVADGYGVDLGLFAEFGGEAFDGRLDEVVVFLFGHEVDGAAAEAAAHDARAGNATFAGHVVEVVEFFAAHLVEFAHAVVGAVHFLTHGLVVAFFEGVAGVEQPLYFFDDIFGAHVVFGAHLVFHLGQHGHVGVAQERHFGVVFLYGGHDGFARFAAAVVGRRGQFVFHHRVDEYQFVAFRVEGHIFVFERAAVEAYQVAGLTEDGGKLVHDAALTPQ